MPATPRTHPPAALRLVDASPVRNRPHRVASPSALAQRDVDAPGLDPFGRFILAVRSLAMTARSLDLIVPSFQSPPRSAQLDRTIQRTLSGDCVVAVRVRGRPFGAVVADAIEGVVVCNDLEPGEAGAVRDELWRAAEQSGGRVSSALIAAPPHAAASALPEPLEEAA